MRKKINSFKRKYIFSWILLILGIVIMLTFALFAIMPKYLAPCNPMYSFDTFMKCSQEHILGTNNLGYDIFSELIYATRTTLLIGILAAVISLLLGTIIGLIAGYFSGVVGEAINALINLFLLIPMLPLAIVLAAYFGSGQMNIVLTISILGWCSTARAVRAKTIALRKMSYVEIMRGLGYSRAHILFRHIMPNIFDVVLAKCMTTVASCIMLEATLGFLGLGDAMQVTWGSMINSAYNFGGLVRGAYNWLLAPGVCIMLIVLSFYFINYFIEFRSQVVKGEASVLD